MSWRSLPHPLFILLECRRAARTSAQLPNGWLWDMVDEFVYQFQSWAQFRGKAAARGGDDLAALKQCERVWNVLSVLNYLRFLADKSGIAAELSAPGEPTAYLVQSTVEI